MEMWTIKSDRSGLRQLTHDKPAAQGPVWSPNGARLAFVHPVLGKALIMGVSKPWTRHALPALPAMGERSRNFDPPNGESLGGSRFAGSSWSPDGRQLAGHRIGAGADGSFQGIVTYSFEFQQFQQLTEFGYVPRYLGDSRRLLFNHQGKLYLVDSRTKKVHLYGSVDGQKFESADPTIMARYSRKYFGRGKDVVAYTLLANHVALQTETAVLTILCTQESLRLG